MEFDKTGLDDRTFEVSSISNSRTYSFICNMATGVSRWSRNAVKDFGLSGEYMNDAAEQWESRICEEDLPSYRESYEAMWNGVSDCEDFEYHIRNRHGEYILVTCKAIIIHGRDGAPDLFTGTIINHGIEDDIDSITGLHSDSSFISKLQGILNMHEEAAVIKIGIKHFEHLNVLYGYKLGNDVLRAFAQSLISAVKTTGYAYRLGGAKFAIVLPGKCTHEQIEDCYNKLQKYMQYKFMVNGELMPVSIYAGAFEIMPEYQGTVISIKSSLTYALSISKEEKHGELVFFEQKDNNFGERFKLLSAIHKDILNGCRGFYMVYQPLVDVNTGKVAGAEALLRWRNDEYGDVPPGMFIPWLETDVVFYELGLWIFRTAVSEMKQLKQTYPDLILNVNITASQLERKEFTTDIMNIIRELDFPPQDLIVELTERCRHLDYELLNDTADFLHKQGIKVSLDDFGTGASALNLLRAMPIDELKLDMSFIRNVENSSTDQIIVNNILNIAKQMNIKTCIEGIETKSVGDFLRPQNATYYQGYFYSKPIRKNELSEYIRCQK